MIREEIWRWVSLADDAVAREKTDKSLVASRQTSQKPGQLATPDYTQRYVQDGQRTTNNQSESRILEAPQEVPRGSKQKRSIPNIDIL
jgi:hypothetical protein